MSATPRVMVVDGEPDLLRMVEMYLKVWKFEVDGFTDPETALENFRMNPSYFSLVLTDVRMPKMSGLELGRELRQLSPDVKVVLVTAYDVLPQELESKLPIVKHQDVLKKPFRLAEVCNAVKKQLQSAQ